MTVGALTAAANFGPGQAGAALRDRITRDASLAVTVIIDRTLVAIIHDAVTGAPIGAVVVAALAQSVEFAGAEAAGLAVVVGIRARSGPLANTPFSTDLAIFAAVVVGVLSLRNKITDNFGLFLRIASIPGSNSSVVASSVFAPATLRISANFARTTVTPLRRVDPLMARAVTVLAGIVGIDIVGDNAFPLDAVAGDTDMTQSTLGAGAARLTDLRRRVADQALLAAIAGVFGRAVHTAAVQTDPPVGAGQLIIALGDLTQASHAQVVAAVGLIALAVV